MASENGWLAVSMMELIVIVSIAAHPSRQINQKYLVTLFFVAIVTSLDLFVPGIP
jgi:hypothetical protein